MEDKNQIIRRHNSNMDYPRPGTPIPTYPQPLEPSMSTHGSNHGSNNDLYRETVGPSLPDYNSAHMPPPIPHGYNEPTHPPSQPNYIQGQSVPNVREQQETHKEQEVTKQVM